MKIKSKKIYLAAAIILLIAVAGISIPSIYAAKPINIANKCSLTITAPQTGTFGKDLMNTEINAKVYKIADLSESGQYTSIEPFKSLALENVKSGEEKWDETAKKAAELAAGKNADTQIIVKNGIGKADNLDAGMYLVVVDNALTEYYEYSFSPIVVSLPDNLYYQSKNEKDDAWVYDVNAVLKPQQSARYGGVKVVKTLENYNETLGNATFVFQIEGTDLNGKNVYSNVAAITFDGAGTKETTVENIPAGTKITVTEVYSGASYECSVSEDMSLTVEADAFVEADFTNTYNDKLVPGNGVVNHFDYADDKGWQWTQNNGSNSAER